MKAWKEKSYLNGIRTHDFRDKPQAEAGQILSS